MEEINSKELIKEETLKIHGFNKHLPYCVCKTTDDLEPIQIFIDHLAKPSILISICSKCNTKIIINYNDRCNCSECNNRINEFINRKIKEIKSIIEESD